MASNSKRLIFALHFLILSNFLGGCGGGGGSSGSSSSSGGTPQTNILSDVNKDGSVEILAFGDSITQGTGDTAPFHNNLRGYPRRLQDILNVSVESSGVGGEDLANDGLNRLIATLATSGADLVILDEGNSDALDNVPTANFESALRDSVTRIKAINKIPVLINQYPNCCKFGAGHEAQLNAVNVAIDKVAGDLDVRVADADRAWKSTCDKLPVCNLLSMPDGVHPNAKGYDVITEVTLGAIGGIDVFAPAGAAELEAAYGLPKGSVVVRPDE